MHALTHTCAHLSHTHTHIQTHTHTHTQTQTHSQTNTHQLMCTRVICHNKISLPPTPTPVLQHILPTPHSTQFGQTQRQMTALTQIHKHPAHPSLHPIWTEPETDEGTHSNTQTSCPPLTPPNLDRPRDSTHSNTQTSCPPLTSPNLDRPRDK